MIQCRFEKQTAQYMEPKNTPEINENPIQSDLLTFSFVTVSLDHPVLYVVWFSIMIVVMIIINVCLIMDVRPSRHQQCV